MASLVRLLAIAASAVIALSFILFAVDQSGEGRDTQVQALEGSSGQPKVTREAVDAPNPGATVERARESENTSAREYIDDGNDILVSPFTGLVSSDSLWLQRVVSGGIGLLLFGMGGLLLANWLPERRTEHTDWRQTAG